jgi:hypothetical protein
MSKQRCDELFDEFGNYTAPDFHQECVDDCSS